jgi:hypothetical protein
MNCSLVRQHLLASERPDQPAPALAAHLARCPTCRAWHGRLVKLEQDLPRLPVPPSRPPARLLEQVLHAPAPGQLIAPPLRLQMDPDATRAGGRQKVALAFALAASLAVFALGWWAWQRQVTPSVQTQAAQEYQELLAKRVKPARTPQARVRGFADMADDLMVQVRKPRSDSRRLSELANHFAALRVDLGRDARLVALADRPALSKEAKRFENIESEALRLDGEWKQPELTPSLRRIAENARAANRLLTELSRQVRA